MPLQREHDGLGETARPGLGAAEARNLEDRRDGECPHLAVELQDRRVRRRLGAERLVLQEDHAFGAKTVFPREDWGTWIMSALSIRGGVKSDGDPQA
jgi:hypothetical protein